MRDSALEEEWTSNQTFQIGPDSVTEQTQLTEWNGWTVASRDSKLSGRKDNNRAIGAHGQPGAKIKPLHKVNV